MRSDLAKVLSVDEMPLSMQSATGRPLLLSGFRSDH